MANKYEKNSREAQDRRRRERSCERKRGYDSPSEAERGLGREGRCENIYECEYCGKWHRSSSRQRFIEDLQRDQ